VPYGMGYIRTSLSGRNKHNGHSAGDCLAVQLDHDRMSFILRIARDISAHPLMQRQHTMLVRFKGFTR
jgi:hypothetical protein